MCCLHFDLIFQLHIESHHDPTSPIEKEVDFFDAHTEDTETNYIQENQKLTHTSEPQPIKNGSLSKTEDIGILVIYISQI